MELSTHGTVMVHDVLDAEALWVWDFDTRGAQPVYVG